MLMRWTGAKMGGNWQLPETIRNYAFGRNLGARIDSQTQWIPVRSLSTLPEGLELIG